MKKLVSLCLFVIASASVLTTTGCYWGNGGYVVVGPPVNNAATSIYVLQSASTTSTAPQVLQFPANATGAPSPSATLSLTTTPVPTVTAIATDGYGDVYVADSSDLREYGPGVFYSRASSTGTTTAATSATPIMLIPANATTTVGTVTGLTVDAYGNIYAAESSGGIAVFSNTANGNVAPNRYILGAAQTGGGLSTLVSPTSLATDNNGNLYVLDTNAVTAGQDTIDVFAPGATGNVAPIRTLTGTNIGSVTSIATDSANNLYATNNLNTVSISIYPPGSTGNATAKWTIDGASTGLGTLYDIAVDQNANIYVVTDGTPATTTIPPNPTILKFANNANGNAAPISSFTSTAWSSTSPLLLAVN